MALEVVGWTGQGFVKKRSPAIDRDLHEGLKQQWSPEIDLTSDDPFDVMLQVVRREVDLLWNACEGDAEASFVQYAHGVPLADRVQDRGMFVGVDLPSRGLVLVSGATGIYQPGAIVIQGPQGVRYANERAVNLLSAGTGVPFVSLETGAKTRLKAGATYRAVEPTGLTIDSSKTLSEVEYGLPESGWLELPNDAALDRWQLLKVSSLRIAANVSRIKLLAKNTGNAGNFFLQLVFANDADGTLLARTAALIFSLAHDEQKWVEFKNESLDLLPLETISRARLIPILLKRSVGPLQLRVGAATEEHLVEDGQGQGVALRLTVRSEMDGRMHGGQDIEGDLELQGRHDYELDKGSSGRIGGICAYVREVPGVAFVRGEEDFDEGAIKIIYWGDAALVDVAHAVDRFKAGGIDTIGDREIWFQNQDRSNRLIRLTVAEEKSVYCKVHFGGSGLMPYDTEARVKQVLVRLIGGYADQGQLYNGSPPGGVLGHAVALQVLREEFPAQKEIELYWGFNPSYADAIHGDLKFGLDEKPMTGFDQIRVR